MELSELLSKAGSLPEAQQRKVAAILGSLVADAAGILISVENHVQIPLNYY